MLDFKASKNFKPTPKMRNCALQIKTLKMLIVS